MKIFKERINDGFKQDWRGRINSSSRATFYKEIKLTHDPSRYLTAAVPRNHRIAMSRLIISSHSLRVETGRWTRPVTPREERTCPMCNKLEDEYHMIFECDMYNELRKTLIPKYYYKRPSMHKTIDLFNSQNDKVLKGLAKFIYKAFQLKNSHIANQANQ